MILKEEYDSIIQFCDIIKSKFGKNINYENIENNIDELKKLILYIDFLELYYNINEKVKLKLYNMYYKSTGIKHQHDLFNNIWNLNEEDRKQKIEKIANDTDYSNLYFADISKFSKCYFSYAAQVVIKRGYPKVEDVIPQLFVWLQDINWPGSYDIYQFLCTIPKEAILKYFEKTVNEAYMNQDEGWLYYLQQLMYELKITEKDFKDKDLFQILNQEIEY